MVEIETNIDDSSPELYEHVIEQLFAAGARDVWLTPAQMKKNRPGIVAARARRAGGRDAARGDRPARDVGDRRALPLRRSAASWRASSAHASAPSTARVQVKRSRAPDGTINVAPEYESCRRVARERNVPLKSVYHAAIAAARSLS